MHGIPTTTYIKNLPLETFNNKVIRYFEKYFKPNYPLTLLLLLHNKEDDFFIAYFYREEEAIELNEKIYGPIDTRPFHAAKTIIKIEFSYPEFKILRPISIEYIGIFRKDIYKLTKESKPYFYAYWETDQSTLLNNIPKNLICLYNNLPLRYRKNTIIVKKKNYEFIYYNKRIEYIENNLEQLTVVWPIVIQKNGIKRTIFNNGEISNYEYFESLQNDPKYILELNYFRKPLTYYMYSVTRKNEKYIFNYLGYILSL